MIIIHAMNSPQILPRVTAPSSCPLLADGCRRRSGLRRGVEGWVVTHRGQDQRPGVKPRRPRHSELSRRVRQAGQAGSSFTPAPRPSGSRTVSSPPPGGASSERCGQSAGAPTPERCRGGSLMREPHVGPQTSPVGPSYRGARHRATFTRATTPQRILTF
jgi:hypothetical protein